MKANQIIVLSLLSTILSGCFTYKSYVPVDLTEVHLQLPISVAKISIEDKREEISKEADIEIPFVSGFKKKSWKHYPELTSEHQSLIKQTVSQNFNSSARISGDLTVIVNYACKEFEQTGTAENERVYLNIETLLKNENHVHQSSVSDTFHYSSMDASNKHFEQFYRTSLQNNIVRNIAQLKNQFYSRYETIEECNDSTYFKSLILASGTEFILSGRKEIDSLKIDDLDFKITKNYKFRISSNEGGKLTYIELLDSKNMTNTEELKKLMKHLYELQIMELDKNETYYCRNLVVKNHEH